MYVLLNESRTGFDMPALTRTIRTTSTELKREHLMRLRTAKDGPKLKF